MCGIFGIANKSKEPISPETLNQALHLLAHRGQDGQGTFLDGPLGMAHTRLAIFDTSSHGQQPMDYRQYTILFNGAIYNFPELRELLRRHAYSFRTGTDTEVIAAAYDHWGEDCIQHFNGMWAFAIYDRRRKLVFCSRDRFGIRPFYYRNEDDHFAFASEIKAFGAIPGIKFRLNKVRAYEFLAYGWQAHTEECMVKGIQQLPAGCSAIYHIDKRLLEIRRYYQLEENIHNPKEKNFEDRKRHFLELLNDSVRLRLRADVPIALSLSGGMDSSAVLGIQKGMCSERPLDCFSVVFPGTPYNEEPYIDAVAQLYQPSLKKITPRFEDIMADLDKTCWHQDEPIASAAVIAHTQLMQLIHRNGFKVMLNGQGADEILGGYDKFYWPFYKELVRTHPWKFPAEISGLLRRSPPPVYESWRRFKQSRAKASSPAWLQAGFLPPAALLFHRSRDKNVASCSRNLIREVGLPVLLQYEDRSAMANGIESRLPFMDHRLVEYCLGLPPEDKIYHGIRKYLLRQAMQELVPKVVLQRYTKMGFPTPELEWMEQHSGLFLEHLNGVIENTDIFTNDLLKMAKAAFEKKNRTFYPVIWRVVAFGAWKEAFDIQNFTA